MRAESYWCHTFLPDLIRKDGVVFDFGVNDGGFSKLIAPRCARVIGFEPDPSWSGQLQLPANVQLVPKALAAVPGPREFCATHDTRSSLRFLGPRKERIVVEALTLADALRLCEEGTIDLVKMDIEGEEVAVLRDVPADVLARVRQLTVEFHDFLDPSSTAAIREVIARLSRLGFHVVRFSWHNYGDVLFINERLVDLTLLEKCWLRVRDKYCRGLARMIRRVTKRPAA